MCCIRGSKLHVPRSHSPVLAVLFPPLSAPSQAEPLTVIPLTALAGCPRFVPRRPKISYSPHSPPCPVIRFLDRGCFLNPHPWLSKCTDVNTHHIHTSTVGSRWGAAGWGVRAGVGSCFRSQDSTKMKDASHQIIQPHCQGQRAPNHPST